MAGSDNLNSQQFGHGEPPEYLFHGTRFRFKAGQILTGGQRANQGNGVPGEHVYASGDRFVARQFADFATGPNRNPDAKPNVYLVQPVAGHSVERDPDEAHEANSWRSRQFQVVRRMGGV